MTGNNNPKGIGANSSANSSHSLFITNVLRNSGKTDRMTIWYSDEILPNLFLEISAANIKFQIKLFPTF
jgi:hypothetical protein